jgi:hypothetical protein
VKTPDGNGNGHSSCSATSGLESSVRVFDARELMFRGAAPRSGFHTLCKNSATWSQSAFGKLIASESHCARDCQHVSIVGDTPGSSRSDPAGMMISLPLRVACGSGEPQFRQNEVEKLRAVERSKRATLSSPDNQRNAGGETYAFAAKALPVALRHREQWHFTNLLNGRSASNSTNPQRHPPRTDISHL